MSAAPDDWNEHQPIYQQLRDRLQDLILDGIVAEGEAMPSVRQVSLELKVNPLTVTRAVQELEETGALEKRRGLGMFVRIGAREQLREFERQRFLRDEWPRVQARIARLNLDTQQLFATGKSS
jgi:GntR family transcriptional regulator